MLRIQGFKGPRGRMNVAHHFESLNPGILVHFLPTNWEKNPTLLFKISFDNLLSNWYDLLPVSQKKVKGKKFHL
jgi:hypothetical protein